MNIEIGDPHSAAQLPEVETSGLTAGDREDEMENIPRGEKRSIKQSWPARANAVLQNIFRYLLAVGMMPYGISKLCNYQFQLPAWLYTRPLGEASGITLTWAFLGYQPWFQFLLGALEIIPTVLLLFRRTRRVGALLLLPVILNIALMNYAMDLWRNTQQIATVFLVMNLYLLACDWQVWRQIADVLFHRPSVSPSRWRFAEMAAPLVLVPGVALLIFFFQIAPMEWPIVDFVGDRQINRAGTWAVRQLTLNSVALPSHDKTFLYFGFDGSCRYLVDGHMSVGKFHGDRARHTFELNGIAFTPALSSIHGAYRVDGDRMILDGSSPVVHMVLERYRWGKQLPFRKHL